MKYRKILLAYNGSAEGKRALLETADLASFLGAETHLLAVASMPPSLFLTEGFVPEELLEEEKKRSQSVLDEGIRTLRERGFNATGRGKYVSDWDLSGQAHGHFVRSDRAHAEVVSIGKEEALRHPGVLAVFTGEDIKDALKSLPCALPVKGRGGMELIHPGRPALAQGRVRFAGDAVALVVAESAVAAQDASELLIIEYRDLPAVVRAEDALKPGAPLVHDS